jgi:methyl-accepting chemotaxis protein
MAQQKYRRSIFLINRPFQLRFSFFVCSWLFALSFVYPVIVSNLFDYFSHYLTLDPNGPGLATIQNVREQIVILLVGFQLIFLIITFMISIFVSHRIAGPLYKLKTFFRQNGDGKLSGELHFRQNDHFKDIAQEYNLMISKLRAELRGVREEVVASANALDGIAASGGSPELKKIIADLHQAGDKIPH